MKLMQMSLVMVVGLAVSTSAFADTRVRGYYKKDGTYVQPHVRSDADGTKLNNWSSKGNMNPYTGKMGTKDPYKIGND